MKYFRVKALYPQNNMAIVADSYGKYDEIWQLSAFLIKKVSRYLRSGMTEKSLISIYQR